jgi:hypothetical protein
MSTTSDDLIERIARLIYDADALRPRLTWERLTPLTQGEYRKEARSALTAFPLAEANTARLDELERENVALREALIIYFTQPSSPRHDEAFNTLAIFATTARAALAGSGEK